MCFLQKFNGKEAVFPLLVLFKLVLKNVSENDVLCTVIWIVSEKDDCASGCIRKYVLHGNQTFTKSNDYINIMRHIQNNKGMDLGF